MPNRKAHCAAGRSRRAEKQSRHNPLSDLMFMSLLYIFPRLLSSIICIFAIIRVQQAVNAFRSPPCRRRRFIFCLPDFCAGFPPFFVLSGEKRHKRVDKREKRRKKRKKILTNGKKCYILFLPLHEVLFLRPNAGLRFPPARGRDARSRGR